MKMKRGGPRKEPPLFAPDVTFIQCPRHAKQLPGQAQLCSELKGAIALAELLAATRYECDRPRYPVIHPWPLCPSADVVILLVFVVDVYAPIPARTSRT